MPLKAVHLFRIILAVLVASLLGYACTPGVPQIVIEEPEAKLSTVILGVASVFMKIVNSGNGNDRLLSVRTEVPGAIAELHDEKDGKMTTVSRMDVLKNNTLLLRPGGKHIMIFKMPHTIKAETEIPVILTFERSGEKKVIIKLTNYATNSSRVRYR